MGGVTIGSCSLSLSLSTESNEESPYVQLSGVEVRSEERVVVPLCYLISFSYSCL